MKPGRVEDTAQIVILLLIGGMAGAASFTHVHDWTMRNVPVGTGDWFGWANAVISELTPTAAGLEIRRRRRHDQPIGYPMTVLVAAVALSLSAQVAEAKLSATGWLLAAVPALAFLALSKLVISRHTHHADDTPIHTDTAADTLPPDPDPAPVTPAETIPPELLTGARMAAFTHRQTTGQPITTEALADHLAVPPTLAAALLHAIGDTDTPSPSITTHANGTRPIGSRP